MNDMNRNYGATTSSTTGVAMDEGLRQYMLGVYNYMGLGVAGTGVISMMMAGNPALMATIGAGPLKWVLFAALIGMGFLAPKVIFSGSKPMAHAMFWLYAALWGALIAPMLYAFQSAGAASEIYKAFFITASLFGVMSLFGYTTKRDLSGMANFLFMAVVGLLLAIVVNALFFKSPMTSIITSSLVVLVFSAVTAYETQAIKSYYQEGSGTNDRTAIFGAFMLYGSFATLFIHILNLLGLMRD